MYVLFADYYIFFHNDYSAGYRLKKYINLNTNEVQITASNDASYAKGDPLASMSCYFAPMPSTPEPITSFLIKNNKLVNIEVEFDEYKRIFKLGNSKSVYAINMLTREQTYLMPCQSVHSFEAWKQEMQRGNPSIKTKSVQQFIDEFNNLGSDPKERQDVFAQRAQQRLDTLENELSVVSGTHNKLSRCTERRLDALESQVKNASFNHNKLSKSMFKEFVANETTIKNLSVTNEQQANAIKHLQSSLNQNQNDVKTLKKLLASTLVGLGLCFTFIVTSFLRV
jgi:hypothetical protein